MRNVLQIACVAWLCLNISGVVSGQEKVDAAMKARYDKFEKLLTGAKFKGSFTLDDKPLNDLHEEEYDIEKVEKLPEPDLWSIKARIKYGNKDFAVPVPLYVKWAGETPVMTLDNITLPGYGTFSARVVLHVDKYAGTWQHDDKGGHLFGRIILAKHGDSSVKPTTNVPGK
jgi:hypothetical protein